MFARPFISTLTLPASGTRWLRIGASLGLSVLVLAACGGGDSATEIAGPTEHPTAGVNDVPAGVGESRCSAGHECRRHLFYSSRLYPAVFGGFPPGQHSVGQVQATVNPNHTYLSGHCQVSGGGGTSARSNPTVSRR